jgi:GntR family transcriptional regulator, arabinose operon transcriptional repressor
MSGEISSKLERVYDALEKRILTGVWPVGSQIPTELELAEEFSCSRSTVGKAIAQLVHDGLVERHTRAGTRVLRDTAKMEEHSIDLDAFAFVYPSKKHEGIWRTVKGFQDEAQERGRRIVLLSSEGDCRKEIEFVTKLAKFEVRGAVVYPVFLSAEDQVRFSNVLLEAKFPIVLAEVNLLGLEYPSVILDGYHAGYTMAQHLIKQGCKRIGFFANYARVPSVRDRFLGYRSALEEARIPIHEEMIFLENVMTPNFEDPLAESINLAHLYFLKGIKVDGLVCVNDFLAIGAIIEASRLGLSVPQDIKITGMEDFASLQSNVLPLTTYRVPFEEIGAKAFDVLEMTVLQKNSDRLEVQVRGELIVRDSA